MLAVASEFSELVDGALEFIRCLDQQVLRFGANAASAEVGTASGLRACRYAHSTANRTFGGVNPNAQTPVPRTDSHLTG